MLPRHRKHLRLFAIIGSQDPPVVTRLSDVRVELCPSKPGYLGLILFVSVSFPHFGAVWIKQRNDFPVPIGRPQCCKLAFRTTRQLSCEIIS